MAMGRAQRMVSWAVQRQLQVDPLLAQDGRGSWFKSCQRATFDFRQRTSGWPEASASKVLMLSMCGGAGKPAWEFVLRRASPRTSVSTADPAMLFIPESNFHKFGVG